MAKYIVLSPDGFSIKFDKTYSSRKKAIEAFEEWKKRYEIQGYYSSVPFGRIPLEELHEYCTLKKL
jgi:hypothetical protein